MDKWHAPLTPTPEKDAAPSFTVFPQTVCNPNLVVSETSLWSSFNTPETSLWSSFNTPIFVISVERIQTKPREHRVYNNIDYIEK